MMKLIYHFAEGGQMPDGVIRMGIRKLLKQRSAHEMRGGIDAVRSRLMEFLDRMRNSPVALHTDAANRQHYELPPEFFTLVLGNQLKYSSCYYQTGRETLDAAENTMLELTMQRAGIRDGMQILELGCGWGSLTLCMARTFPSARITAVSNSALQKEFILRKAARDNLSNVTIITRDMRDFETDDSFDRVISVEMFEHMRNYPELFRRIAGWLKPEGRFFMHIFTHHLAAYEYETSGDDDWMGKYFFTGGIMPADSLPLYFQDDLLIEQHWVVNGTHYQRTADQWLQKLDENREAIEPIMAAVYGHDDAARWLQRWRIFFMACAELWGFRDGSEWIVSHYRFKKR